MDRCNSPSNPSIKSWIGSPQILPWTNLTECMRTISNESHTLSPSNIWWQQILDGISSSARLEQMDSILNGYAELYQLELNFIKTHRYNLIKQNDTQKFCGISSSSEQQNGCRNVAYIICNTENMSFTMFYVTGSDGRQQVCFASDDERIDDAITDLLNGWNRIKEMEPIGQNNDATMMENAFEEPDDFILYDSLESGTMTMNACSSSGTNQTTQMVWQNLDWCEEFLKRAKDLQKEFEDIPSSESDDHRLSDDALAKEQQSISHNGLRHAIGNRVTCDENVRSDAMHLRQNAIRPTPRMTVNESSNPIVIQFHGPPKVTKQPKRHRRTRMVKELENNKCPRVQAGKGQREYPEIEVSNQEGLYVRMKATTENRHPHPCITLAPENAWVDWTLGDGNERRCLRYDLDSFDPALECVYSPVTAEERQSGRKKIKVRLFKWKQFGPGLRDVIERENLRLCRLEFCFCTRSYLGPYQPISEPSYTTVIEETDRDIFIDPDAVEPKKLCALGGEKILVPLNAICPKKDFSVKCNGSAIPKQNFTMERNKLSIISPSKGEGVDELHLIIDRTEYIQDTSERTEHTLYDEHLPYVAHGKCTPTCPNHAH